MKKSTLLAALAIAAATAVPASAQENGHDYEPYPYTFIGVQGGAQVTFSNPKFSNLLTPIGSVSVGRFFTSAIGARLNVQGWQNKSGYRIAGDDKTYKFNYITTDLDLMVNLSNIIWPKNTHFVNAILFGGVGLSYAWDNDEQKELVSTYGITEPAAWDDDRLVHNFRIGMQFEFNVSKHVGINLEVAANHLADSYNSKKNGAPDWQATGLVGLTYKFGFQKKKRSSTSSTLAAQDYDNARNAAAAVATPPVVKEEPKPAPVVEKKKEKTSAEIFYTIGKYEPTGAEADKIAKLAEWLKAHPTAKVSLTGYADAGTGSAEINKKISQQRADNVAKLLTDKYGIDASRISTSSKGDTVQPFSENDQNRVVISIAEE